MLWRIINERSRMGRSIYGDEDKGDPEVDRVLESQKIGEELLARVGEHRLGVELDAFDLPVLVTQSHDDAAGGGRGNVEASGQTLAFHNQGVIARSREGIGEPGKDRPAVVLNGAGLAVHDLRRADHFAAVGWPIGLWSGAAAQEGKPPPIR